ncbi:hypothetical protein D3C76_806070 [compost metagenome]
MGVSNQLAIQVQQTGTLIGAEPQRLDAELHTQVAALVEEGLADAVCQRQLFDHVAADQGLPLT